MRLINNSTILRINYKCEIMSYTRCETIICNNIVHLFNKNKIRIAFFLFTYFIHLFRIY